MEMRENYKEEMEQEIEMSQLEFEDYIWGSDLGLIIVDENWNTKMKSPEEIAEELLLDDVKEFYYIESDNLVKILFKNGCTHLVKRV